jgi:hypothetical protein
MAATKKKDKQSRLPNYNRLYRNTAPPLDLASQEFRIDALVPDWIMKDGQRVVPVDGLIETLSWRYEPGNPVLMGDVTLRKPDVGSGIQVDDGYMLRCRVTWFGRLREVWRMRLRDGESSLDGSILTFTLADDGILLQESEDDWSFTKSKKKGHPYGWKTHDIVREVCRRYRIPVGKIAEGTHWITDLSGRMSPMQVIQKAYAIEKNSTGRRFTIRWEQGKLNVVPLQYNPVMYELGPQIEDATIKRKDRGTDFGTAYTVKASLKTGAHKRKKISVTWINERAVRTDGFVHRILDGGNVKDRDDALNKAKRTYNQTSKREPLLTGLQHRGIAFLKRGDAIRVLLGEAGIKGNDQICFLVSGSWQLSGGSFTMSVDVSFTDPYVKTKQARRAADKKKRAEKRKTHAA